MKKQAEQATVEEALRGEYRVKLGLITQVRKDVDRLLTTCDPDTLNVVHRVLETPTEAEASMVKAWRKFGSHPSQSVKGISISATAKNTVSGFGLACLVAYGRAWLDARECELSGLDKQAASLGIDLR